MKPGFLFVSILLTLAAGPTTTSQAQDAQVGTGIANTGEQTFHEKVTIGPSPAQIRAIVEATLRKEDLNTQRAAELDEQVARLSKKIGVRKSAVENFLRILGEARIPLESLREKLAEIAQRHRELLERWSVLEEGDDPQIRRLTDAAKSAIDQGDYDRADHLLAAAEGLDVAAARQAQALAAQATAAADRRLLSAAAKRARRGELRLIRFDYPQAAKHFEAAMELVPDSEPEQRLTYRGQSAAALYRQGDEKGDNPALEEAIRAYRELLAEYPRERVPLDWAMTQNNLGVALRTLGERESGTGRLEEAVAAYRAALQEHTRERVPLQWATTQNNLGAVLRTLGERESGTARLEEAVAAYRAALQEHTRERVPLDWAMTQNNLGTALWTLGERESGTARLKEAVTAYRAALQEYTRERVPLQWATTQNNLGTALQTLGEREAGTARLEEAVAAYRAALQEYTRERVPLDWARTKNNLGNALWRLGERESDTARLKEAVAAYRAALQEYTRERVPLDWAMTQSNLGVALRTLGERESGTARLEAARGCIENAWRVYKDAGMAQYDEDFRQRLAAIDRLIAERPVGP